MNEIDEELEDCGLEELYGPEVETWSETSALKPEIMGQYPSESVTQSFGGATVRVHYQNRAEMEPLQDYPHIIEEILSGKSPEEILTAERLAIDDLRSRVRLPSGLIIPPPRITNREEAWEKTWTSVFGEGAVLQTEPNLGMAVEHLNYTSVSLPEPVTDALEEIIKTDRELINESQEALAKVQIIPDTELNPTQLIHLNCARDIIQRMRLGDKPQGTYAAIIPPASERTRTAGLYSKQLKIVYIALEQLGSMRLTVDTLDHEFAHHTSQAEDLEEAHALAISQIAGYIVEQVASGKIDKFLKDPNFRW